MSNDKEGGYMSQQNPFIWHELVTPDQKNSGAFFSQLFGWTRKEVDAGPFGIYTLFQKNGEDVAGMMNPTPDTPVRESYWHSYIAVENADECARQAPLLGGSVLVPPHDVPDVGRICIVADPTGAIAHLMQSFKQ
jgi:predicted enzyme related to lactoylglutathione lyase